MKKRILAIIFVILFITSILWLIIEGSKAEVLPIGSNLPAIDFLTQNGRKSFTETDNKTLIIFFSKECPHCKYELEIIDRNIVRLKDIKIYLLTADINYLISDEIKNYNNLLNSNNVAFGIVNKDEFSVKFGSSALPSLYFFNTERKLTAKIKGETKFERICSELKIENQEI